MMKYTFLLLLLLLLAVATPAAGQAVSAGPTSTLVWNQAGPSLAVVQTYTYTHCDDGKPCVALTPVTCTAFVAPDTSGFTCSAPFPAETAGTHTMTIVASDSAGASLPSAPISFIMILVVPAQPTNVRLG